MNGQGETYSKSVKKALDILNCFTEKQPIGITEISEKLGLYKSNVHTIVRTLVANNYLEQDKDSEKYYLGISVLHLSRAVGDRYSIKNVARPYLNELANAIGERVYLYVPIQNQIYTLYIATPVQDRYNRPSATEGYICRMHCTGAGKAMLAYMSRSEVEQYISTGLEKYTERTITNKEQLYSALEQIRAQRWAEDDMEWEIGIRCLSVPVISRTGEVLGAVSVSGPSIAVADETRRTFLRSKLQDCVSSIKAMV